MKHSLAYALLSALLTAPLLTAAPAPAQTAGSEMQTHVSLVSTADLDLGTASGKRLMRQRLGRAAREVCGTASDADLKGRNEVRKCREEAVARAATQLPELIAASRRGAAIAVTATR